MLILKLTKGWRISKLNFLSSRPISVIGLIFIRIINNFFYLHVMKVIARNLGRGCRTAFFMSECSRNKTCWNHKNKQNVKAFLKIQKVYKVNVQLWCSHCMSTFEGRDVLLESEFNFILFVCFSFGLDLPILTFHFRF